MPKILANLLSSSAAFLGLAIAMPAAEGQVYDHGYGDNRYSVTAVPRKVLEDAASLCVGLGMTHMSRLHVDRGSFEGALGTTAPKRETIDVKFHRSPGPDRIECALFANDERAKGLGQKTLRKQRWERLTRAHERDRARNSRLPDSLRRLRSLERSQLPPGGHFGE